MTNLGTGHDELVERPQGKPVPLARDALLSPLVRSRSIFEQASELLENEFVQLGQAPTEALSICSLALVGGLSFSGTQERKARRALGRCKPDGIDRRQCVADAMPMVSLVFRDPQTAGCRSESKALPARVDSKCMTQNKVIGMLLR